LSSFFSLLADGRFALGVMDEARLMAALCHTDRQWPFVAREDASDIKRANDLDEAHSFQAL